MSLNCVQILKQKSNKPAFSCKICTKSAINKLLIAFYTDRKIAKDTTADATYTPQFFMPDVYAVQNYYAFGQSMPKWSTTATVNDPTRYRYGFNGKEDDDEWGKQDYGARIYDPRVGRWLSVDPLARIFSNESPYLFGGDNPIYFVDKNGEYKYPPNSGYEEKYKKLTLFLQGGIGNLLEQQEIRDGLKLIGNYTDEQINELANFGEGIEINITQLDNDEIDHPDGTEKNGEVRNPQKKQIFIDETLVKQLQDANTIEEEQAALLGVAYTILHESVHVGVNTNPKPIRNRKYYDISIGLFSRKYDPKMEMFTYYFDNKEIGTSGEDGKSFGIGILYGTGKINFIDIDSRRKQGKKGMSDLMRLAKELTAQGRANLIPKIE